MMKYSMNAIELARRIKTKAKLLGREWDNCIIPEYSWNKELWASARKLLEERYDTLNNLPQKIMKDVEFSKQYVFEYEPKKDALIDKSAKKYRRAN